MQHMDYSYPNFRKRLMLYRSIICFVWRSFGCYPPTVTETVFKWIENLNGVKQDLYMYDFDFLIK